VIVPLSSGGPNVPISPTTAHRADDGRGFTIEDRRSDRRGDEFERQPAGRDASGERVDAAFEGGYGVRHMCSKLTNCR
jgi:hypothetical protein